MQVRRLPARAPEQTTISSMLNYTTHALADLKALAPRLEHKLPLSAVAMRQVIVWLEQGAKFVLPDGGGLVELGELDGSFFRNLRLPYPVTVLEVPFMQIAQDGHSHLITQGPLSEETSSKRIALLVASEVFFSSPLFKDNPLKAQGGIVVMSVFYQDSEDHWAIAPSACILSDKYAEEIVPHAQAPDQAMVELLKQSGGLKANSSAVPVDYVLIQPEVAAMMRRELGAQNADTRMSLDVRDEMHLALEFCLTINCSNVQVQKRAAPAALNKKRLKSGKVPFYDHHVIQINPGQGPAYYLSEGASQGIGKSPRMHTRRGHIRRLPTGKTTFVRATVVGSSRQGIVEKTYVVGSNPSS